jgi:glycosyltransferase involved in cell wall biosynthesis
METQEAGSDIRLSVVLPCLNEAKTLGQALGNAALLIAESGLAGELVVADNGSVDASREIAAKAGARVVTVSRKGYGFALLAGIRAARGSIIVMGDADATYDFREAQPLVQAVAAGADLAMGSRLRGRIEPGAMPWLHRHVGTPVLTALLRLFFGLRISDCNCGMRAFSRAAFDRMHLVSGGMEFASEMLIKAALLNCKVVEAPCSLLKDTRGREPHLQTWRDGWRHLRFILLFAPHIVFLMPGWALTVFFGLEILILSLGPVTLFGNRFDYHHLFYAFPLFCTGYQLLWFSRFAVKFRKFSGLDPDDDGNDRRFSLEWWLFASLLSILAGVALFTVVFVKWWSHGRSELFELRSCTAGLVMMVCGILTIMNALMLSMMELHLDNRK